MSGARRSWKVDGTEGAVLDLRADHPAAEFGRVDLHQLAEIGSIDILDLRRCDHQIVEDRIIENRLPFPVIDNPAGWIYTLAEQRIFLRLHFVLFGDDLQVEKLCRDDEEQPGENKTDDVATRLIEYRHSKELPAIYESTGH